jgi:hypothetical protein
MAKIGCCKWQRFVNETKPQRIADRPSVVEKERKKGKEGQIKDLAKNINTQNMKLHGKIKRKQIQ